MLIRKVRRCCKKVLGGMAWPGSGLTGLQVGLLSELVLVRGLGLCSSAHCPLVAGSWLTSDKPRLARMPRALTHRCQGRVEVWCHLGGRGVRCLLSSEQALFLESWMVFARRCQVGVGVGGRAGALLTRTCTSFPGPRGKSQVALKIIRNVGKYREAARLEINVLKKIKEKDKENKL